MIMTGRMLNEFDGKKVRDQDRKYLYALANQQSRKRGMGGHRSQSLSASDRKEKRANSHLGALPRQS